jgi:hypothetical protein
VHGNTISGSIPTELDEMNPPSCWLSTQQPPDKSCQPIFVHKSWLPQYSVPNRTRLNRTHDEL